MKTFKTAKGTDLQVMSLKGKDYMTVQQRILWFVEENPRYDINTVVDTSKENFAIAKTTLVIFDEDSKVIRKVTAHKTESSKDFPDYIEKAEAGSLGRALSYLGYGTQFAAADLDEASRIVDSPVVPKSTTTVSATPEPTTEAAPASAPVSRPKFGRKPATGGGPSL
jgi:hypothetical protein